MRATLKNSAYEVPCLHHRCLSNEDARATGSLDLLLGIFAEDLSLHNKRLVGQLTLAEDLEIAVFDAIDDNSLASWAACARLLRNQSPQFLNVDDRAEELLLRLMEVAHADLTEVSRVAVRRTRGSKYVSPAKR